MVKLPLHMKERLRALSMQTFQCKTRTIQCIASVIGSLVSALLGVQPHILGFHPTVMKTLAGGGHIAPRPKHIW